MKTPSEGVTIQPEKPETSAEKSKAQWVDLDTAIKNDLEKWKAAYESEKGENWQRELVRNLDLSKITDYQYRCYEADKFPDLKRYFEEREKDPRLGILSLTDVLLYRNENDRDIAIDPQPDEKKLKENGALIAYSPIEQVLVFNGEGGQFNLDRLLNVQGKEDALRSLFERVRMQNSDPELVKEVESKLKEMGTQIQGKISFMISGTHFEKYFVASKPIDINEHKKQQRYIEFSYGGHHFIMSNGPDNNPDYELENMPDNVLNASRYASKNRLWIDGIPYKEKCKAPKFEEQMNSKDYGRKLGYGGWPYTGFGSWRKWVGLEDNVVVDEV